MNFPLRLSLRVLPSLLPARTLKAPAPVKSMTHWSTEATFNSYSKSLDDQVKDIDYENQGMDLSKVVSSLKEFAAPTLADSWDNVGLLIEPSPPHIVKSILLTNDLTLPVFEEAVSKKMNFIVSYHPPIFAPLKRLTQKTWKELIAVRCVENRIAVYSPHTSFDAVVGGVNDWLISPFKGEVSVIEKVQASTYPLGGPYRLDFTVPNHLQQQLQTQLHSVTTMPGVSVVSSVGMENGGRRLSLNCSEKSLSKTMSLLNQQESLRDSIELVKCEKPPIPNHGYGRMCVLSTPMSIQHAVDTVKKHLALSQVRLALAVDKTMEDTIETVAVCAGSGASVLGHVQANLIVTGEMSHHQVLDATHKGTTVILCDHSNTERGYLNVFRNQLEHLLHDVQVTVSETDSDPLQIV